MTNTNLLTKEKMHKEKWIEIPEYNGKYYISNYGCVKNIKGKILKLNNHKKYKRICLYKNGIPKHYFVHRLVAESFIENPYNKPFINHLDSNPSNNKCNNLEWCTQSENIKHSYVSNNRKTHLSGKKYGNHPVSKKVICYDIHGNFLYNFESISKASIVLNINAKNITGNLIGHRKTTSNYIFKYDTN